MSKITNQTAQWQITPIGVLKSPLSQKFGVPRQPNLVNTLSEVVLYSPYDTPLAVQGLAEFSHIWLLWQFHQIADTQFRPLVRPPRLGGNEKVGVFASRSMFRPNPIGMSVLKLEAVQIQDDKASLLVWGADMIDGTPILDIKPYIMYSDAIGNATSSYAKAAPKQHPVVWENKAIQAFAEQVARGALLAEDQAVITDLISYDPRPAYHASKQENDTMRQYKMCYKHIDVVFYKSHEGFCVADMCA